MEIKSKTTNKTLKECDLNVLVHHLPLVFKTPNHYLSPRTNSEMSYFSVALSNFPSDWAWKFKASSLHHHEKYLVILLAHLSPIHVTCSFHPPSPRSILATPSVQRVFPPILPTIQKWCACAIPYRNNNNNPFPKNQSIFSIHLVFN